VLTFSFVDIMKIDIGYMLFIVAGFAVFFLWMKVFYFFRIFRPTSAFIRMIMEMLFDIKIFLLIFFTGILAFSNAFYVFDLRTNENF
jgi:hypothetical protein